MKKSRPLWFFSGRQILVIFHVNACTNLMNSLWSESIISPLIFNGERRTVWLIIENKQQRGRYNGIIVVKSPRVFTYRFSLKTCFRYSVVTTTRRSVRIQFTILRKCVFPISIINRSYQIFQRIQRRINFCPQYIISDHSMQRILRSKPNRNLTTKMYVIIICACIPFENLS